MELDYEFDLFGTDGPCVDCGEAPAGDNVQGLCPVCLPNYYFSTRAS